MDIEQVSEKEIDNEVDNGAPRSGVGVIDKAVLILAALERGPSNLAELVERTGLPRPTAHRLATALEHHRLIGRGRRGQFALGPRLGELAGTRSDDTLLAAAPAALNWLKSRTGESAQVYRRQGDERVCIAAAERTSGLRDTVPVGTALSMKAGSAAQVLLAWQEPALLRQDLENAKFSASLLTGVRRRGWAQSVGEREMGVASVSAPVRDSNGKVLAAISVSGPIERLTRTPGRLHAEHVQHAARRMEAALRLGESVNRAARK